MLRFSHLAVPVGNVPSIGIAETGRQIAVSSDHWAEHVLNEVGRLGWNRRPQLGDAGHRCGHLHLDQTADSLVDGGEVLLYH